MEPGAGVVSTMSAQARYTDPSTRSFIRAATWLGLGAFAVAALVALLAWQVRDRSPRSAPPSMKRAEQGRAAPSGAACPQGAQ